jgi:CDP-2,3-bis-(O-geranylgeranyl)-sn-glycerol synthase
MDFGRHFFGNDLFGPGKTWEGFLFGVAAGTMAGIVEILTYGHLTKTFPGFPLPVLTPIAVFCIAAGAMLGDLLGSFIKRRFGIARGEPAPLLDQLDFVACAFLVAALFVKVSLRSVILILFITPVLHYLMCFLGYKAGLKKEPW